MSCHTGWVLFTAPWHVHKSVLPHTHLYCQLYCPMAAQVYEAGDASVLTPDVGGKGTLRTFTDAVLRNL